MAKSFPNRYSRERLLRDAADRAIHYLSGLDERPVRVTPDAFDRLAALSRGIAHRR